MQQMKDSYFHLIHYNDGFYEASGTGQTRGIPRKKSVPNNDKTVFCSSIKSCPIRTFSVFINFMFHVPLTNKNIDIKITVDPTLTEY